MNRLQVLSLTTLMLMIAFRLPGQTQDHEWDAQIVVCNDGKIGVDVARAYRHPDYFSGDQWEVTGWFHVDPGKCEAIGKSESYATGGVLLKDPITLLAFGFRDSTGVSGSIRFSPGTKNYYPTNQQFCVETEGFLYRASGSNPPRDCTGAQFLIPASYEFTGPLNSSRVGVSNNELHVSIGPNDRAIPFGKQSSGSGVSQSTGGGGQSKGDANVGACGKVSCWDLLPTPTIIRLHRQGQNRLSARFVLPPRCRKGHALLRSWSARSMCRISLDCRGATRPNTFLRSLDSLHRPRSKILRVSGAIPTNGTMAHRLE
jgi:hypothetical protein